MTLNGIAYSLPDLAPRMNGTGAGSSLPTLTKRDARTLKGGQDRPNKTGGPSLLQTMLNDGHTTGRLNPRWCEWFMGFPENWTKLIRQPSQRSETPRHRSKSNS
jgi:hypothetical protein